MTNLAINTTQNVNIDFATASLGERILAFIIDIILLASYLITIQYFISFFSWDDYWSYTGTLSFLMLPAFFYTLITESILGGQTFGKKIMKIKVVKIDGFQASFLDYFMRWILRIVDIFTFSGVVAILSIVISEKNQRLGDMAAGTAIISLKSKTALHHTILMELNEEYIPRYSQVQFLSDKDARIIKNNYDKALHNADYELLGKIVEKIESVLDISKGAYSNHEFIKVVLEDFNYFTQKH